MKLLIKRDEPLIFLNDIFCKCVLPKCGDTNQSQKPHKPHEPMSGGADSAKIDADDRCTPSALRFPQS